MRYSRLFQNSHRTFHHNLETLPFPYSQFLISSIHPPLAQIAHSTTRTRSALHNYTFVSFPNTTNEPITKET